jgi:hypothetical protein
MKKSDFFIHNACGFEKRLYVYTNKQTKHLQNEKALHKHKDNRKASAKNVQRDVQRLREKNKTRKKQHGSFGSFLERAKRIDWVLDKPRR